MKVLSAEFKLCLSHTRTLDEEALSLIAAQTLAAQKSLTKGEYREGLSLLLRIVECAMKHARTERASDPAAADGCIALAMRLQLIAAAFLKEADSWYVSDILNGSEALSIALRCEAKVFIMQPVVQQWVRWKWYGFIYMLINPEPGKNTCAQARKYRRSLSSPLPSSLTSPSPSISRSAALQPSPARPSPTRCLCGACPVSHGSCANSPLRLQQKSMPYKMRASVPKKTGVMLTRPRRARGGRLARLFGKDGKDSERRQ